MSHNTYAITADNLDSRPQYYAAQQQEQVPLCITQPGSSEEVSQALNILREQECAFAVKSGGHSTSPGASSINGGVVIDLKNLNIIKVSDDESFVSVGTGNTWNKVYTTLEKQGLLAVGGRVGSVGVGGFVLGGERFDILRYLHANSIYLTLFRWNIFSFAPSWLGLRQCAEFRSKLPT